METDQFQSFQEFWPFYLMEHSDPKNRMVHFIGTSLVFLVLIAALLTGSWNLLWILPVVGYAFAWVGHFFIQRNKPATFRHPLWSLMGDFKMFFCILTGRIHSEYEKIKRIES